MGTKVIDLNQIQSNRHQKTLKDIHEILKERTPMSDTDEWTKQQLQYSHETMWDFIQCFDLYDEFYKFVMNDCNDFLDKGNYHFFKGKLTQEYTVRELI